MKKAPIAIFAYNRPAHFMKTIDALLKNELADESELFIFSDGPRSNEDRHSIEQVRKNARRIKGFKKVTLIERKINYGLADSIVEGVTTLIEKYKSLLLTNSIEYRFKPEWKYKPKLAAKELYGTTDFYYLLLILNGITTPFDFKNFSKIRVLDPNKIDIISDLINQNSDELETVSIVENLTLRKI